MHWNTPGLGRGQTGRHDQKNGADRSAGITGVHEFTAPEWPITAALLVDGFDPARAIHDKHPLFQENDFGRRQAGLDGARPTNWAFIRRDICRDEQHELDGPGDAMIDPGDDA